MKLLEHLSFLCHLSDNNVQTRTPFPIDIRYSPSY